MIGKVKSQVIDVMDFEKVTCEEAMRILDKRKNDAKQDELGDAITKVFNGFFETVKGGK